MINRSRGARSRDAGAAPIPTGGDLARWERWRHALQGAPLPCAVVDLDAFEANARLLLGRVADAVGATGAPLTLRPATKSVRVPALLEAFAALGGPRVRGLMTFSARETAWLHGLGFDDLLLAYPIARPDEARALAEVAAAGGAVTATLDHPDHVSLLAAAARETGATLSVCVDLDVSWRLLGGRLHLGVRRSPIRDAAAALALAARAADAGLRVTTVLAYEAQVAGLRERNPTSRHLDPVRRLIRQRSAPLAAARRRDVVEALRDAGHPIAVVNGGGTGSLETTAQDGSCTEVTLGSGLLAPHLFDGLDGLPLQPAGLFAIAVNRASDPGWVTCASGGFIASGPPAADRAPVVHLPPGLTPDRMEGFGEVQTPLALGRDAPALRIGDPVLCRHAKAGELAERFDEVLLVRGDRVIDRVPTYRGLGRSFG